MQTRSQGSDLSQTLTPILFVLTSAKHILSFLFRDAASLSPCTVTLADNIQSIYIRRI